MAKNNSVDKLLHDWLQQNKFSLEVLKAGLGLIPGVSVGSIIGRNTAISATEEVIWDYGGDYTLRTTEVEMFVSSTSILDTTNTLLIRGMDGNYNLKTAIVTPTGQTQTSIGNFMRVFSVLNVSGTKTQGTIYVAEADTLVGGIPATASKVHSNMLFDNETTYNAFYTVPAGYTAVFDVVRAFLGKNKDADVSIYIKPFGGVLIRNITYELYQTPLENRFPNGSFIPEKTTLIVKAKTSTNTSVTFNSSFLLLKNSIIQEL